MVASGAVFQAGFFAATVLVARMLGRAQLGRYAAASAIGLFIVSGAGSGMPVLALREVAAGRADRDFVTRVMRIEFMVTGVATILAALVGMILIGRTEGLLLGGMAGLGNIALAQFSVLSSVHAGLNRFSIVAGWQTATGLLIAGTTLLTLTIGWGTLGSLTAIAASSLVAAAGLHLRLPEILEPSSSVNNTRLFRRSTIFVGIGLVYGGYQRIDTLIVYSVAGPATAGLYASVYKMLSPFSLLAKGFSTVFFSRLSATAQSAAGLRSMRRRGTALLALALIPLALLAIVIMPLLIRLLFGVTFSEGVTPARILVLSTIPYALYLPTAHALNAVGREAILFKILLVSTLVEAVLVTALASRFRATGTAVAWLATEVFVMTSMLLYRGLRPNGREDST